MVPASSALLVVLTACLTPGRPASFCRSTATPSPTSGCAAESSREGGEDLRYSSSGRAARSTSASPSIGTQPRSASRSSRRSRAEPARSPARTARQRWARSPRKGSVPFEGECAPRLVLSTCLTELPRSLRAAHRGGRARGRPMRRRCLAPRGRLRPARPVGESCAARPSLERPACVSGAMCGIADLCVEEQGRSRG